MELECQSCNYRVELTPKQWDTLMSLDYLDDVLPALEELGAINIEYDGHFGRAIYFTCNEVYAQYVLAEIKHMLEDA